jgi:uncharacterized protein YndB with AHSA1/START domain
LTDLSTLERSFTLVRTLDAPPAMVFAAWTEADELYWYFSPVKPPTDAIEVDLRVGGAWRQQMIVAEDEEYVTGGIFVEIVPHSHLVFRWGAVGGWPSIDPERPEEAPLVTIDFNEVDGRTEMVFRLDLPAHFTDERVRNWFEAGIQRGWTDTIDRVVAKFATDSPPS